MNNVCIVGRITKEPELTQTSSGIDLLRFTIAVNRKYKDANGEKQADFISCVAWRNQAKFISDYVKKGHQLSIVGSIQTGSYTDSDNQVRYTTDVLVESVSSLEKRDDTQAPPSNVTPSSFTGGSPSPVGINVSDDDLPFGY